MTISIKLCALSILFLTGCSGTLITRQNAIKECPSFNVPCDKTNQLPDFPVKIVGNNVVKVCNGNTEGCVTDKTIYIRQNDWRVLGHEKCHNYCSSGSQFSYHFKEKKVFTSLLASAKAE